MNCFLSVLYGKTAKGRFTGRIRLKKTFKEVESKKVGKNFTSKVIRMTDKDNSMSLDEIKSKFKKLQQKLKDHPDAEIAITGHDVTGQYKTRKGYTTDKITYGDQYQSSYNDEDYNDFLRNFLFIDFNIRYKNK